MSFKVRAKCLRTNFKNNEFRIFSWSPISNCERLKLSPYMTFSSKGEDSYIVEGKDYELEVEEISCDPKYGSCVRIISVPSMAGLDFKTLTRAESFEILMDCTSSEKIANNTLLEEDVKLMKKYGISSKDQNEWVTLIRASLRNPDAISHIIDALVGATGKTIRNFIPGIKGYGYSHKNGSW